MSNNAAKSRGRMNHFYLCNSILNICPTPISHPRHEYTIVCSKDDEGYSGRCVELPAAISQGERWMN
jgi:hypothetical protein